VNITKPKFSKWPPSRFACATSVCNLVPRVFALVEVTDKEISAIKINSVPKKHKKPV
jgi:hypothetical protein